MRWKMSLGLCDVCILVWKVLRGMHEYVKYVSNNVFILYSISSSSTQKDTLALRGHLHFQIDLDHTELTSTESI